MLSSGWILLGLTCMATACSAQSAPTAKHPPDPPRQLTTSAGRPVLPGKGGPAVRPSLRTA